MLAEPEAKLGRRSKMGVADAVLPKFTVWSWYQSILWVGGFVFGWTLLASPMKQVEDLIANIGEMFNRSR